MARGSSELLGQSRTIILSPRATALKYRVWACVRFRAPGENFQNEYIFFSLLETAERKNVSNKVPTGYDL